MSDRATFLHLTDLHVSTAGVTHNRDDVKVNLPGIPKGTREQVLDQLFERLAERLATTKTKLDGVIFSGDAQDKGEPGGHERVHKWLIERLAPFGITANRIVATPGNHDVPRDSKPSSPERYDSFVKVWSNAGCVVPWLDGVDTLPITNIDRHRLVAGDGSWAIFPINTSNWSQVITDPPEQLQDIWHKIPDAFAGGDKTKSAAIRKQLEDLLRYDMARVSPDQLEALRAIFNATADTTQHRQLRIAVMHHHLHAPSLREEVKPFADLSNLAQVRALMGGCKIDVAIHGHKHEEAVYYDHIYANGGDVAHRLLVLSGATFSENSEQDAMRLLVVEGLPHVPSVSIEALPLPRPGAPWKTGNTVKRRLWTAAATSSGPISISGNAPILIQGTDLDEVYVRACEAASTDAHHGTLIVHLDLPATDAALPLPSSYELSIAPTTELRQRWINDLVQWWQRDRSQLEHRIPYLHGSRLRRYGGKLNQISRIIDLLRIKDTTRAIAVLIDPFRDFTATGADEEFASFCLVEFRRRDVGAASVIDVIAFYRAQEFSKWWPVNVAELRQLQIEIGNALGFRPGRITTIAGDARTVARSPTLVAMPIIDRWLDQAPERLHLLADALVHCSVKSKDQQHVIDQWRQALAEFREATSEYNPDGIPMAIEGLRMLSKYINVTRDQADQKSQRLAWVLSALADHNQAYERGKRQRLDFELWVEAAKGHVTELEELTNARVLAPQPVAPRPLH